MGRLYSGENSTTFSFESGTYGAAGNHASGQWIGLVTSFDPDDSQNINRIRYHGTSTRSINKSVEGAEDYGASLAFHPQDFRMLYFALGSCGDLTTGSPAYYTHNIKQLEANEANGVTSGTQNPFVSFSVESQQGFIAGENLGRVYNGCVVDSLEISSSQGEPLTMTADLIAQSQSFSSGALSFKTVTELTRRPYMWSDTIFHMPSGTKLEVKDWSMNVSNNFDRDGAHVNNGSRVITTPSATERGYELTCTMEAESTQAANLYGLWKSGGQTQVNAAIEILNFADTSGTTWITLSGCDIDSFEAPNPVEGVNEWSLTMIPQNVDGIVEDQIETYRVF